VVPSLFRILHFTADGMNQPNPRPAPIPYSRRMEWHTAPNPLSTLRQQLVAQGREILDLTGSNPTTCGLGDWSEAIADALRRPEIARYQPLAEGLPTARQAVSDFYASLGTSVDPEHLLLTASTSESYSFLFQMLCDPGDEVLIPAPSYPLFEHLAALSAVRLQPYRLRYEGEWLLDTQSLEAAITPRTRAIIVVNPNNPTASYLREFEARHLLALCAQRGLALVADEVFWEHTIPPIPSDRAWFAAASASAAQHQALCFSLGGLSKSAGMPQMKVGWIVVNGSAEQRETALERLRWIADTYLSVSAPVQYALRDLLEIGSRIRNVMAARIAENARAFRECAIDAPCLTPLRVEGGWSAVLRLPALHTDQEWCELFLTRQHLWVQPGYFYDFHSEAHVVLSLLTETNSFLTGLRRISAEVGGACG